MTITKKETNAKVTYTVTEPGISMILTVDKIKPGLNYSTDFTAKAGSGLPTLQEFIAKLDLQQSFL